MIFVSACLIGCKCRYDGKDALVLRLRDLFEQGFLFSICPELLAGLSIPRSPMNIEGKSGYDVLERRAKVINIDGIDLTCEFIHTAKRLAETGKRFGIKKAILKDKSPSCGVHTTHTTTGLVSASGVTAEALRQSGIQLYDESCDPDKVIYEI